MKHVVEYRIVYNPSDGKFYVQNVFNTSRFFWECRKWMSASGGFSSISEAEAWIHDRTEHKRRKAALEASLPVTFYSQYGYKRTVHVCLEGLDTIIWKEIK